MITSSPGSTSDLQDVEEGVLAAGRDHAFRGSVGGAEVGGVPLADRLPQLQGAAGGGVAGEVLLDGANGRALDVGRRGKVRFARPEVHDVPPARPQLGRDPRLPSCGGDVDAGDPLRQLDGHRHPFVYPTLGTRRFSRSSTTGGTRAGDVAAQSEDLFHQARTEEGVCLAGHQKTVSISGARRVFMRAIWSSYS